jgi:hypothetical protein
MRKKLYLALFMMLALPALAVIALLNAPALAADMQAPQQVEVIATNLSNPRGMAFGPDGSLYVAEAGRGGDSNECLPNPEGGDPVCYGPSGAVTRILSPTVLSPTHSQIITGLASVGTITGTSSTGPHDVAFDESGNLAILIGLGGNPLSRTGQLENLGWLVTASMTGTWTNTVDIAGYEVSDNPDGGLLDSNPFGLLAVADGYLVTDAGANALLHVSMTGTITTVAVFPERLVEFPPGSGNMIPMQAVPTSVAMGPDGAYYVGQLTGFPFPVGGANVYRVVPGEEPEVYQSGFTNILGVDFDADGNLYVLEMATNGLLSGDPTGALVRVTPNGLRGMVTTELFLPTGLIVGPDGYAYVSNFGVFPDSPFPGPPTGQVVRIALPDVPYTIFLPLIAKAEAPELER